MYYCLGGNISNPSNIQYPSYGFRPVVCLKSGCSLVEDPEKPGEYKIIMQ